MTDGKRSERYRQEDEKKKEAVEARNQGDALVYQVEKTLKDFGDKVGSAEKAEIEQAKDALKEALKRDNIEEIKQKSEALSQTLHKLTERIYKEAGAQAGAQGGPQGAGTGGTGQGPQDDNVVDADYEVVDDDNKK